MREILFRGKTLNTHKWIYGGYYTMGGRTFIVAEVEFETNWNLETQAYKGYRLYEVDPDSVGQYIGQVDVAGDRIFDGDIVYVPSEDEYANIFWNEETSSFILGFDCWCGDFDYFHGAELEIRGNTFDEGWYDNGNNH